MPLKFYRGPLSDNAYDGAKGADPGDFKKLLRDPGPGGGAPALEEQPPPGMPGALGERGLGKVGLGKVGLGNGAFAGAPAFVHTIVDSMPGTQLGPWPSSPALLLGGPSGPCGGDSEAPFGEGSGLGMPPLLIIPTPSDGDGESALAWIGKVSPALISPSSFPMVEALLCGAGHAAPLADFGSGAVLGQAPRLEPRQAPGIAPRTAPMLTPRPAPTGEGKLGLGPGCGNS